MDARRLTDESKTRGEYYIPPQPRERIRPLWERLKRITILLAVIPWTATGILLLAGAGIFSWLAGYLLFAIGEGILAREKKQDNAAALWQQQQLQIQSMQGALSLVEMDVQMKYRDKSVDLRVVN